MASSIKKIGDPGVCGPRPVDGVTWRHADERGRRWAVHVWLLLDWLQADVPVSTSRLAASYELPSPTSTNSSKP
jgi:hypothetical protein